LGMNVGVSLVWILVIVKLRMGSVSRLILGIEFSDLE